MPVDTSRDFSFINIFSPNEQCRGGGGYAAIIFFCSLFPVQQTTNGIGHRVKYGSFFGLATNTLIIRNSNNSEGGSCLRNLWRAWRIQDCQSA